MGAVKDVKVLVVEDNALILDLLMKGLTPHCDASAAADGGDALMKVLDAPPDLILCDYRIPGLDGRQLYDKLRARKQTRQIPFIFLASRGDIEEKLRPVVEGVEEFIPKPFFLKDLVRIAKKVIDRLTFSKPGTKLWHAYEKKKFKAQDELHERYGKKLDEMETPRFTLTEMVDIVKKDPKRFTKGGQISYLEIQKEFKVGLNRAYLVKSFVSEDQLEGKGEPRVSDDVSAEDLLRGVTD